MILKKYETLPRDLQNKYVEEYYNIIATKKHVLRIDNKISYLKK